MKHTVSVVIPTHNYGHFIGEALESVFLQTLPADEVIVVDDGSTDETGAVLDQFGDSVRYIWQKASGVSAARNRGLAASRGSLIAFLDADDTWEPSKLEKQVERFGMDKEIGLVHCGVREFDSDTGHTISIDIDGGETDVARNLLLWDGSVIVGPGGTILVSRQAFYDAGGFDDRIKVGEDWDLCYRIARKYKVGFVAEPLVNYRSHGSAAHRNVDEMERGMALFYKKAFDTDDGSVLALRRRALGNYHRVMAGSFLHAGRIGKFAEHSIKSIWMRPANIGYFAAFPFRLFSKTRRGSAT